MVITDDYRPIMFGGGFGGRFGGGLAGWRVGGLAGLGAGSKPLSK